LIGGGGGGGGVVGQLQLQIRAGKAVTAPLIFFLFCLWIGVRVLVACELRAAAFG
jgi:hypothetical protein